MDKRDLYVVFSVKRGKYFEGTIYGRFYTWTKNLQDAFWFLTKEKAEKLIERYDTEKCEIKECIATYPNGRAAYIRLK